MTNPLSVEELIAKTEARFIGSDSTHFVMTKRELQTLIAAARKGIGYEQRLCELGVNPEHVLPPTPGKAEATQDTGTETLYRDGTVEWEAASPSEDRGEDVFTEGTTTLAELMRDLNVVPDVSRREGDKGEPGGAGESSFLNGSPPLPSNTGEEVEGVVIASATLRCIAGDQLKDDAEAANAVLKAASLLSSISEERDKWMEVCGQMFQWQHEAEISLAEAKAENERLREAIKQAIDFYDLDHSESSGASIMAGILRKAIAALTGGA